MMRTVQKYIGAVWVCALAVAMLAFVQTTAQAQQITLTLEEVSMPLGSGDYCFDNGSHDRQINVLMNMSGFAAGLDTMGSATIDVEFDNTVWSYQAPGFGAPTPTDLLTVTGAYSYDATLTNDVIRVTLLPPATLENLKAGAASVIGTDFGLVRGLCFDAVTAAASKSQAAVGNEANILPNSLVVGTFTPPATVGRIQSCTAGTQPDGDYPDCAIENLGGALPVELSSLQALAEEEGVVVTWSTASETNNAGFSIEHARGVEDDFAELAYVEGHGTTTDPQDYSFRAAGMDIGLHRFRLRQIDFDGTYEYSEEIEVMIELAGTHRLGAAYPNPFNPSTTFELIVGKEQQVRIDVINALGQRVQRMFDGPMEANEPTNFVFDARLLPTGLYFYRVVGENFMQTRQMLLVK